MFSDGSFLDIHNLLEYNSMNFSNESLREFRVRKIAAYHTDLNFNLAILVDHVIVTSNFVLTPLCILFVGKRVRYGKYCMYLI